jgi:deaminated glutathione amidase
MPRPLRLACLQTRPLPDFASAADEALRLAAEATDRGARFLALPEYCGGLLSEGGDLAPPAAPEETHPVLAALRRFAAERAVPILVGSVAVTGPGGRIRNRGVLIDADGRIRARYDKIHLFDVRLSDHEAYEESQLVEPGDRAVVADMPFARIGLSICYDLRFAALYRALAQAGAEILAVPAAFTRTTGEAHWHVLNRARAIENGAFVVAPCATGPIAGGGESYGHSLIVDPWGEVIADGGTEPGVVIADIDLDRIAEVRARIPSLRHDRPFALDAPPGRAVA